MIVSAMKTALQRYAGVDSTDPLLTWLNAAYHEFEDAVAWSFLEKEATIITMAAGATVPSLPADFSRIVSISVWEDVGASIGGKFLEWFDIRKFRREISDLTVTGKPRLFYLINENILQIYPIPDTTYYIRIIYEAKLIDLAADGDVPAIPVQYHYALVQGAAALALQAESEEDRAATARGFFEQAMERAAVKHGTRQLQEFRTVAIAEDDISWYS